MADPILQVFEKSDPNGQGLISESQLRAVLKRLDPGSWDDARLNTLFQGAGLTKDGRVDVRQFFAWLNSPLPTSSGDKPGGKIFFIAGYPSAGKTFMGDYLATRGWGHVDGDLIANPEAKAMGSEEKVTAFWAAMQKVFKGGSVEREEWVPYYDLLIELTKRACKKNRDVVLSYAVLGIFGGEKELFKQHFPNMKFIHVKVDHSVLIDRFWKRHEKMKEEAGFTDQDYWDYHEMDEARAEYGPVFSKENMTKFMEKTVYNPRLINIPPGEPDCFEINNNDTKSNVAFEQLNKIAGLPWKEVDTEAISQINYERYKDM